VTDILSQAEALCAKLGDRRLYYANCGTVAEDFSRTGNQDFQEVAHPEDPFWCEILVGVNLLPGLVAEIKRLRVDNEALLNVVTSGATKIEIHSRQDEAYIKQLGGQLQAILTDEETPGWIEDYNHLMDGSAFPVFEIAKKWITAYRKAQNSNLVRKKQCEDKDVYIARLEKAYLEDSMQFEELAKSALAQIREAET
jgi:hypothetical protein